MNRGSYAAASVLFSGSAVASFLLVTFNTGWILRELNETLYIVLLACTLLVPMVVVFIANMNDQMRRVLMLAMVCLFEVCSYVVVSTMQNAGVNTSFIFYTASITWYSLMLGSALSIMMLSIAELGRVSRAISAWPVLVGVALAMAGLIMGANLAAGFLGWVQHVLLAMILAPAGFLVLLVLSPPRDDPGPASLLDPESLRSAHVVHPLKGGFLAMFYLVNGANIALLVGVNGLGLDPSFFLQENFMFYASMGLGVAAGSGISCLAARKLLLASGSTRKDRDARLFLLGALAVQFLSWAGAVALEILASEFHGSTVAQVVDGTVAGVIISLLLAVTLVHHPPRGFMAHVLLPVFCIGAFIVAGQMLKAISMGSATIDSLQEYLPWILIPELVIVGIVVILAAMPSYRTNIMTAGESK